jgi:uncharacterized protein (TIRG00374 family)
VNAPSEVGLGRAAPPGVFRDLLRLGLGLIVGGVALWLALRGAVIGGLRTALSGADVFWIGVALGSVILTVAVGVVRWRLLFHPESTGLSWSSLAAAFLIGQMLNIMLPLRLGEMARAYWLSRSEDIPVGRALGTIGVEKLADLTSFGLAAVALLVLAAVPPWVQSPGRVLAATGALAATSVLVLAARRRWIMQGVIRGAAWLPSTFGRRLVHLAETGLEGSRVVSSWKASAVAGLLSLLVLVLAASTNYLLFVAFHLKLPLVAALLLLVTLQVGNTVVSVPGNIGVFHYITVLTLSAYSVDHQFALAYAIVLYAIAHVPKVLAGAVLLVCAPRELTAGMFAWRHRGGRA